MGENGGQAWHIHMDGEGALFNSVRASTGLQGSLGTLNLNGPCCLTPLLRQLCEAAATRWLVFVISVIPNQIAYQR